MSSDGNSQGRGKGVSTSVCSELLVQTKPLEGNINKILLRAPNTCLRALESYWGRGNL